MTGRSATGDFPDCSVVRLSGVARVMQACEGQLLSGEGTQMARRRRTLDPVVEHRRRMIVQAVGITVLVAVAIVLVHLALRTP